MDDILKLIFAAGRKEPDMFWLYGHWYRIDGNALLIETGKDEDSGKPTGFRPATEEEKEVVKDYFPKPNY